MYLVSKRTDLGCAPGLMLRVVRTGKYRRGDEDKGEADDPRPETFDSFAHFVDAMLDI